MDKEYYIVALNNNKSNIKKKELINKENNINKNYNKNNKQENYRGLY